jgi:hypothetical protein
VRSKSTLNDEEYSIKAGPFEEGQFRKIIDDSLPQSLSQYVFFSYLKLCVNQFTDRLCGDGVTPSIGRSHNRSLPLVARELEVVLAHAEKLINCAVLLIRNAHNDVSPPQWTIASSEWQQVEIAKYVKAFQDVPLKTHIKILSTVFPLHVRRKTSCFIKYFNHEFQTEHIQAFVTFFSPISTTTASHQFSFVNLFSSLVFIFQGTRTKFRECHASITALVVKMKRCTKISSFRAARSALSESCDLDAVFGWSIAYQNTMAPLVDVVEFYNLHFKQAIDIIRNRVIRLVSKVFLKRDYPKNSATFCMLLSCRQPSQMVSFLIL